MKSIKTRRVTAAFAACCALAASALLLTGCGEEPAAPAQTAAPENAVLGAIPEDGTAILNWSLEGKNSELEGFSTTATLNRETLTIETTQQGNEADVTVYQVTDEGWAQIQKKWKSIRNVPLPANEGENCLTPLETGEKWALEFIVEENGKETYNRATVTCTRDLIGTGSTILEWMGLAGK